MNELMVLLPAFNEEENLASLVGCWQSYRQAILLQYNLQLHIVVVNDGSEDGTEQIGKELALRYDNVVLLHHKGNQGLGQAVSTGIHYILDHYPDSIFTCLMDCDNTHQPRFVFDMLEKQRETSADIIVASRYEKGAEVRGVSPFRLFLSEAARYVYTVLLRVENVRDYTCGYRLYRNDILLQGRQRFGDFLIEESGFACMAELLYKLYSCGAVFSEVPFELRYDLKAGKSKMRVMKTAANSIKLAFELKKLEKERKREHPSKLFIDKI